MTAHDLSGTEKRTLNFSAATVSIHALTCGHFSLPEYQFVHPISKDARRTVPSLAFLIQHTSRTTGEKTRIVFDLGLRRDVARYAAPIQKHIQSRQPMTTLPDITQSLARGGLKPKDINYVIYSHVHWDHVGEPQDFPASIFVVGYGALTLLNGASSTLRGGHSFFEKNLLPEGRTIELSDPLANAVKEHDSRTTSGNLSFSGSWQVNGPLPQTLDLFNDGSLLIVDAPGHLPGHINLLARTSASHQVYLAGDACHDRRLLTGEKTIGEWNDAHGHVCCIHADRRQAEETIERIKILEQQGVEIILAHDDEWESNPTNKSRFFGAAKEID